MVLQSVLQGLLQRQFGTYLEDFDKQQINVGIWQGNIELKRVRIKKSVFNDLDFPIKVRFGIIDKLTMNVPWNNLSNSPVIVNLDGLYVLLEPESKENWKALRTASIQEKESILSNFTNALLKELEGEKKDAPNQGPSFVQKLSMRIVDNLQIKVRNIHIRYEDPIYSSCEYAFGVTLKALDLHTTNENWEQEFFDRTIEANKEIPLRKRLIMMDLAIYLEDKAHHLFVKEENLEDKDVASFLITGLRDLIPGHEPSDQGNRINLVDHSLVRPITLQARLTQLQGQLEPGEPRHHAELNIQKIQIYLKKSQYTHITRIADVANDFKDCCITTHHQKFRIFLPDFHIGDSNFKGNKRKLI